ncbi:beta-glucoside-specific PTS transporter subunit IIABC [Allocoprobacillus halotolerans]|uniref:Beta-glucoside-specific PTS transporter subunit IIABC n=1 Tax=Allocoprobacillus halotolerans TaxID=2944914 RepID=A0ABY5I2Q7_9FIRM|nr:beta-glucoside-specific PTS transporter subunit IIABC [Allocoprobacillus halotolerans]UTY38353.1 beta-glucoside-specific PTS transporter subunit IIABC [Allocoprobacillus halotolerans]
MKYEKLSKDIIKAVGGKENIVSLQHCMTRLRFALKDESKANDQQIEAIDGVLSLIKKGGQYQIVIGTHVHDVYLDVCQLADIQEDGNDGTEKEKKGIFNAIFSTIIGCIGPIIPILVGTGLGKCILLFVSMMGWADAESSMTYYVFNFVFDSGITFLPVFTAVAAARHFKCNMYMAAVLGCALVHPNWNAIVSATDPKFIGDMFGFLPLYGMPYTSTLIPSILIVYVMSKLEFGLNKVLPELVKGMLTPLLTLLIMTPIAFIVLAPAMGIISIYLGEALLWVYNTFGMFAIAIMCIVYPWMVATGMHATLAIAGIQILSQSGYDPFSRTLTLTANMAQGAAAFACAVKTKNSDFRNTCLSAGFTAFFAGITEPCIYGVTVRLKKPMYAVMIGCFAGGLYAGFCGLKAFAFMTPSIVNFPMWIGGDNPNNLMNAIITMIISAVVTFITTLLIGFDDIEEEHQKIENKFNQVNCPVKGKIISLEEVHDEMFSKEVLGKGVAIIPSEGKIYAPANGVISATFETKHAIGMTTDNGTDILIHVGIDTVKLEGKPFVQHVEKGEYVKAGTLLLEFDMKAIEQAGFDSTTMVVVTNSQDYLEVIPTKLEKINKNDPILTII